MSSTEQQPIPVLHQDDRVVVVNKPCGMPSQEDGTGDASVVERLKRQLQLPQLGLVHRLDRPVSGALLLALDAATLRTMNAQFKERAVRKTYHAIVEGAWSGGSLVEHHLERDGRLKRALITATAEGPPARLHVRTLVQGDRYTLLEVSPEGGAFHQIRAQLAAAGHAIKGDVKYGARRGEKDRSIALHARSLSFHHPADDRLLEVLAPHPETGLWVALLTMLP
jgi:23S rRNA pseudouridine1911/1915/1917 synthase